jgi:hypothetical protein
MKHKTLIHFPRLRGPVVAMTPEEQEADRIERWRLENPPVRVTRQRVRGWMKPAQAVYVGRGTMWGNPWKVEKPGAEEARRVVRLYHEYLLARPLIIQQAKQQLAGKDLMCWCAQGMPCHADVLLRIANQPVDLDDFPVGLNVGGLKGRGYKGISWAVVRHTDGGEVVLKAHEKELYVQGSPGRILSFVKF